MMEAEILARLAALERRVDVLEKVKAASQWGHVAFQPDPIEHENIDGTPEDALQPEPRSLLNDQ